MIGLASPIWLTALLIIPLIWWLHKFNQQAPLRVSSLIPWKSTAENTKTTGNGRKSDPLWLLRALIASVIILALSAPYRITEEAETIEIWFDDSFSLLSIEETTKRSALAIDAIIENLEKLNNVRVLVRSLNSPERSVLTLETSTKPLWRQQLNEWLKTGARINALPPLSQFSKKQHWLVTDGSSAKVNRWFQSIPFSRILKVGKSTENSAITLFAIRPELNNGSHWQTLIRIQHFGLQPDRRVLTLAADNQVLLEKEVSLEPDKSTDMTFDIDSSNITGVLSVSFLKTDTLPEDDRLTLSVHRKFSVRVHGSCVPGLLKAIEAHPTLSQETESEKVDLNIVCGHSQTNPSLPTIHFHQAGSTTEIRHAPVWDPSFSNRPLFLRPQWLKAIRATFPKPQRNKKTIFSTETMPLVILTESDDRQIDCYIDMDNPAFLKRPEYPLFFAYLVDLALKNSALDNIQSVKRKANDSRIRDLSPHSMSSQKNALIHTKAADVTNYLIIIVILLLLVDYGLFSRSTRKRKSIL